MATSIKKLTPTIEDELNARDAAPLPFQAEVLRGQICDDLNRRFWRGRSRLASAIEQRKEAVQRDVEKLPADQFLEKYNGWRFL